MLSDFLCLNGGERLYLNTFRYTPEMVDCKLCTEYRKTKGCTAQGVCPWLAERIEAGVVGYGEAVMGSFPHRPRLQTRLTMAEQLFNGSLWADEQHQQRWYNLMARFKYCVNTWRLPIQQSWSRQSLVRTNAIVQSVNLSAEKIALWRSKKRKDLGKYYAVIFLFSGSIELNRRTINCVERQSIEFFNEHLAIGKPERRRQSLVRINPRAQRVGRWADTFEMSDEDYTLFAAARSIAVGNTHRLLKKLEDISAVGLWEFCVIVNALLIERYGLNAFNIK